MSTVIKGGTIVTADLTDASSSLLHAVAAGAEVVK
jgi:hypothetical protein